MKKLKLSLSNFEDAKISSRENMKNVLGGDEGSGGGGVVPTANCHV